LTQITTTVKADLNADFTYEVDISNPTLDVLIRRGRQRESSQPRPGTCTLQVDNSAGIYTPKAGGSAIRPMHGIQVVADSQALFTGFVTRVFLHPSGQKQDMVMSCADWLWILSRTDVSLPMFLNVRSDILAHRIADLAEIGELFTNTRFRDNITPWTAWGTAAIAYNGSTSSPLHTPGVMEINPAASLDGAKYDVTSVTSQNDEAYPAIYVRPAGSSFCTVRLVAINNGVRGDVGAATVCQAGMWTRVDLAGTTSLTLSDATKREIGIEVAQDVTFYVGATHATLFKNAIPRNFDEGQSIFSHIAPRRTNALRAIQEVANNELGGLVYVNGSGTLVFEDRHHRWRETASRVSQGTIDEDMVDVPYEEDAEDLIGEVELHYTKWEEGATSTTSFALFPVPRTIPANGTLAIDGDFGARALMRDVIVPVANTDYKINHEPGGGGADESSNVTLAFEDFGGGFQAVFTSSVGYPTYLTEFAIRATPVRIGTDQPTETYTPAGAPDYASKLKFTYRIATSQPDVEAWATYLGDRYVTQRERLPVRLLNKTTAILAEMTDRVISERVTITNDNTAYSSKVNGPYYIDSVEHHLSEGKTKMETTWGVVPADNDYWILGTSKLETDNESRLAP
jgi:hypothetical protein